MDETGKTLVAERTWHITSLFTLEGKLCDSVALQGIYDTLEDKKGENIMGVIDRFEQQPVVKICGDGQQLYCIRVFGEVRKLIDSGLHHVLFSKVENVSEDVFRQVRCFELEDIPYFKSVVDSKAHFTALCWHSPK